MTRSNLGFSARFAHRRLSVDEVARGAALDLLESTTWVRPLRYFISTAEPGHKKVRRPGMVAMKERRAIVDEMLVHPANNSVALWTASYNDDDFGQLSMDADSAYSPLSLVYGSRAEHGGELADAWVEEVALFFDRVGAIVGVIVKMDAMHVSTEITGGGIVSEGVFQHPARDEFERMRDPENEPHVGTRYARFPRWGTLLSHDHVAQLGGVRAISAAVDPAVVRELSAGVYFQMTTSIEDARGDEAAAKQRAFTALAAPLLPPARG